ncbi:MAG: hypothetical protein ACI8S6_003992 [Myxococcota bacterium]|jgi:hypothetical protein
MDTPAQRLWPALRASLLAVVIGAEWLDALPLPTLRPGHLNQPIAQAELSRWTEALNGLGVSVTKDELTAAGLEVGAAAVDFQKASMAPLRPLKKLTQTGQSWGLFAYPDPFAGRLIVEVWIDGEWQSRFRAPGADRSLLSRRLRYRRVRGIYDDLGDRPKPRGGYSRFADWVALTIMADDPRVEKVQVRLDLVTVRLPDEGPEQPEERRHVRIRDAARLQKRAERLSAEL